jgi:hypothetical protein
MEARGGTMVAAAVLVLLVFVPEACRAEQFIVGDTARWTWGYNYTDWVVKKGPFFQNDSLGTCFAALLPFFGLNSVQSWCMVWFCSWVASSKTATIGCTAL